MVPVDLVNNPFRVVYLPFASEGLNQPVTRASSNLALFHGLCAVSAENMLNLKVGPPSVDKLLAARHNRLALVHLQDSIAVPVMNSRLAPTLSAILICIMRDTVTGEAQNWRGHVQGALSCLPEPQAITVEPGSSLHITLEQFLCLAVFGNIDTKYDLRTLISRLPETLSFMDAHHGINKFLLCTVLSINKYAAMERTQQMEGTPISPASVVGANATLCRKDMERLELQAYLHAPTQPSSKSYSHPEHAAVALHYAHVYYLTLLIHFQRSVHHAPPVRIEQMVTQALSHLELAEEVGRGSNGCIHLWPCLIIASECTTPCLKARALAWFGLKKRHGFGNMDMGPAILNGYWRYRKENAEKTLQMNWQEFVRDTQWDIVPI